MSTAQLGTVETQVPARLDRLPWSKFHWRVVIGLGTVWILDGLEVTIVGSIGARLTDPDSGLGLGRLAGPHRRLDLRARRLPRRARLRPADRPLRAQEAVHGHAARCTCSPRSRPRSPRARAFFFVCRFFTGAGIGGEYAAINSAIDELIPARVRGRVDLIINGSYWLGAALGALGAYFLLQDFIAPDVGWRLAFGLGAVLGVGDPGRAPPRAREPALAVHPRPRGGGRADRRRDRGRGARGDGRGARRAGRRRSPSASASRSRCARSPRRRSRPTRSAPCSAWRCSSARPSSTTR